MTEKTYRIKDPMAGKIIEITKEYIAEHDYTTDSKVANAIMQKGIEIIDNEDIKKYLKGE